MTSTPYHQLRRITSALVAASLLTLSLAGCISYDQIARTKNAAIQAAQQNEEAKEAFLAQMKQERAAADREEEVDKPYLAGRPIALSRDAKLPVALRDKVITVLDTSTRPGPQTMPLAEAVQRLSIATGIQFRVDPDVYLPPAKLLPKSLANANANAEPQTPAPAAVAPVQGVAVSSLSPLPSVLRGGAPVATSATDRLSVEIPGDGKQRTAREYADLWANRLGINWEYNEDKQIGRFYRLVTKTWKLPVGSGKRPFTNEFKSQTQQVSVSGSAGNSTDPETQVKVKSEENKTPLEKIADTLGPALTLVGQIAPNEDTGTITMTDTKEAVERADDIIRPQVTILNRQVLMQFQTVQVVVNDNGEEGTDWNAVIQGALHNVPGLALGGSPTSLVSSNAGSFGFTVLDGAFKGTSAVVRALNEIGRASTSIDLPMRMRNRRAATYDTSHLFYFISGSSPAVGAVGGSGGVPGYTQSAGSVGFKLFVYPDADTTDDVNLTISFDNSVLNQIIKATTGQGVNQQTFDQPDIDRNGVGSQDISIHNGQTMLLTGFDQTSNKFAKRTMGSWVPLIFGGSLTSTRTRTFTLVFVTVGIRDQGTGS